MFKYLFFFFFSSRRRHTRCGRDWSSTCALPISLINDSENVYKRIDLEVGVSYGEDLERVRDITIDAVKNIPNIQKDKEISLFYKEFGGSSINFTIMIWVEFKSQLEFLNSQSEAIIAIKKAYDREDIMIPFPIRTLDFGIKGGEKLNEVLPKQ